MAIGGLTSLHTLGGFDLAFAALDRLRPQGDMISRSVDTEDESTAEIWARLEDLRRQRTEAEADVVSLPRKIAALQTALAALARLQLDGGPVQLPADVLELVRGLNGSGGGPVTELEDEADLGAVQQLLQGELNRLQDRWHRAPVRIAQAQKEIQRLRARLQARDIQYDAETGGLRHIRTGQSIDPVDLVSRMWDKLKENYEEDQRRRAAKRNRHEEPQTGLHGLLALLASIGEPSPSAATSRPVTTASGYEHQRERVRAYVKTQVVVAGGTTAGAPRRLYEAKRAVMVAAGEVGAGGLLSQVADLVVTGTKGPKEVLDPNRRPEPTKAGPAAFAALIT